MAVGLRELSRAFDDGHGSKEQGGGVFLSLNQVKGGSILNQPVRLPLLLEGRHVGPQVRIVVFHFLKQSAQTL